MPDTVGVGPVVDPLAGCTTTGGAGAVVSRMKVDSAGSDSLPAASVCTATTVYSSSSNGVVTGISQELSSSTTTSPSSVPLRVTVIVAPGSPVPAIVGVSSVIVEPSTGAVMVGASGAVASTVKVLVLDPADLLPAASMAKAWT